MTSNSNNSTTDSPCCSSSGGTDSRTSSTTNVNNNNNMNLSSNQENHIQSAVQSTPPLSSPPSSVCALTTPYESRIISGYPRLGGLYGPSYSDQNSFYTSGANPFYSSFVSNIRWKSINHLMGNNLKIGKPLRSEGRQQQWMEWWSAAVNLLSLWSHLQSLWRTIRAYGWSDPT